MVSWVVCMPSWTLVKPFSANLINIIILLRFPFICCGNVVGRVCFISLKQFSMALTPLLSEYFWTLVSVGQWDEYVGIQTPGLNFKFRKIKGGKGARLRIDAMSSCGWWPLGAEKRSMLGRFVYIWRNYKRVVVFIVCLVIVQSSVRINAFVYWYLGVISCLTVYSEMFVFKATRRRKMIKRSGVKT